MTRAGRCADRWMLKLAPNWGGEWARGMLRVMRPVTGFFGLSAGGWARGNCNLETMSRNAALCSSRRHPRRNIDLDDRCRARSFASGLAATAIASHSCQSSRLLRRWSSQALRRYWLDEPVPSSNASVGGASWRRPHHDGRDREVAPTNGCRASPVFQCFCRRRLPAPTSSRWSRPGGRSYKRPQGKSRLPMLL